MPSMPGCFARSYLYVPVAETHKNHALNNVIEGLNPVNLRPANYGFE